jgi:Bacterial sugar transferase/CoA-binding domain
MSFPAAFNPERSRVPPPPRLAAPRNRQSLALNGASGTLHTSSESGRVRRAAIPRANQKLGRNVLIVGAGPVGRELAATLQREYIAGRTVVGFLDETEMLAGDVLGRVEDLARIARAEFVDEIILAIPTQHDLAFQVIREARRSRLSIRAVPDLYVYGWDEDCGPQRGRLGLEYFGDLPVLTLHEEKAPTLRLFSKRVLDVLFSVFALVAAAPFLAAIAVMIKLTSRGQVLYRAKRVGRKGREFVCYKFRTMVFDADLRKDGLRSGKTSVVARVSRLRRPRASRAWADFCGATVWMNSRSCGTCCGER